MMTVQYEGEDRQQLVIEVLDPNRTKVYVMGNTNKACVLDDRSLRMLGHTLLAMTDEYAAKRDKTK